jgi:hypothetical protein
MSSFVDGVPQDETFIARYNFLYYDGVAEIMRPLPIAGLLAANAEAESYVNGLTMLWRPEWGDIGEKGSYAMSLTLPYVSMEVEADVPGLRRASSQVSGLGDIVLMPVMFNYKFSDDFNVNTRLGVYAPTGEYQVGRLANLGKNFWTFEPKVGFMYFGQDNGIEASLFAGLDLNLENPDTNYQSGNQFTLDGTLAQHFPALKGLVGIGVNGWYYQQVNGDSGTGAFLGQFKGMTTGLGPVISYSRQVGDTAVTAELKWLKELDVHNRLEGDYVWLKVVLKF